MRILYFYQHFTTPVGATGTRAYEFAKHLVNAGHEVTMVCGSCGVSVTGLEGPYVNARREGLVDGIRVIEFEFPYSNRDGFIKRSCTFVKFALRSTMVALGEKYDLVFATSTPLTASIPGISARWLRRKPFVFEVRDLWPELPREMGVITNPVVLGAMSVLEWVSYRSADKCIGLAPGIVDGIAKHIGPERVDLIPNGCDLEIFDPRREGRWRPEGIGPNDFLAVYAGTHGQANGLDAVLDAAAILKKRNRGDIKLLLVGEGKLKPQLVERAGREGLDNVIFHESVNKYRIGDLLRSADVGMQILANVPAFYFGTSPNKFFDYIAAGLPVLNNYPGWVASLIDEHQCGKAGPAENPTAFAEALVALADAPQQRAQMGRNARLLAESQFDRAKLALAFEAVLKKVAGRR
ncbi:MAG: glycosyltransferase family 4 protein [Planctomycetaceae bacterium]